MTENDSALCALLADDLPRHFDHLVLRFQVRLFSFALRLTGSRPDAEDLVQEAFIGAYVSLENYPPERIRTLHMQAWLYRILFHAYQHHRRGAPMFLVPLSPDEDEPALEVPDPTAVLPEHFIEQMELRHELQAVLAQLPERYRIPITCFYFAHLSYQEIADLLDQPLGTIKSAMHRGLRQLHALLAQERGNESWNPSTLHAQNP